MPHTITILPASTQNGRETIRTLLASHPTPSIRAIYRDPSKAPREFTSNPNFTAIKGDIADATTLDFSHSDTVFYIPPATFDGTDTGEWAARTAGNVKAALARAQPAVKRLLVFSVVGAQYDKETGIMRLNHVTDGVLGDAVKDVVFVKPSYFMVDFVPMVREAVERGVIVPWITPVEYRFAMVDLKDIASTCASILLLEPLPTLDRTSTSPRSVKLFGPRNYSFIDMRDAISEVIGKEVKIEAVERDQLVEHFGARLPPPYAQELVDMTTAVMPGGILDRGGDFEYDADTITGKVELIDFVRGVVEGIAAEK